MISELPDPHLKGKFPEEEMHIMAYLAKECLLLNPDDRPTMSEVVQILLTIAPDKSRRNIHGDMYQVIFYSDYVPFRFRSIKNPKGNGLFYILGLKYF